MTMPTETSDRCKTICPDGKRCEVHGPHTMHMTSLNLEPAPASPAREDRLFESGCCLCGSTSWRYGLLGLIRTDAGNKYCGDCNEATVGQIDAEVARRRSLAQPAEEFKVGDEVEWTGALGYETGVVRELKSSTIYCYRTGKYAHRGSAQIDDPKFLRLIRRAPQAEVKPVEYYPCEPAALPRVLPAGSRVIHGGSSLEGYRLENGRYVHPITAAYFTNPSSVDWKTVAIQPEPTQAPQVERAPSAKRDPYRDHQVKLYHLCRETTTSPYHSDLDDRIAATRAERDAKKRAQALKDLDRPAHPPAWPADSFEDVGELGVLPVRAVRP